MIEDLAVPTSANFFSIKKKLSQKAVEDLFVSLRARHGVTTHNEFKHTREQADGTLWSAVCFKYESPPAFLEDTTAIRETLCGYLMLVEYQGYAAVLSSRLSLPSSFKTTYFSPVPIGRVEGAIATADAVFQRMRMRNMSLSPYAMRNKTIEAQNLANVVSPAGTLRYAPRTYSVIANGNESSATPSTGRIGIRSSRVDLAGVTEFVRAVIDALRVDGAEVSPFIRSFARPVSLAEALEQSEPTLLAVDTNLLADAINQDQPLIRLVREEGDDMVELSALEITVLLAQLDQPLEIEDGGRVRIARDPNSGEEAATISLNKNRIALRSLSLPPASDVFVEDVGVPLGEDEELKTLREFLDEANAFIILFDDVRLAYIDGHVFRDETLLDGGVSFLRFLRTDTSLDAVVSEKGTFTAAQTAFDAGSTFGCIVDHIGSHDAVLICDDLGDEWADFIGIKEEAGLTQVSFYHAKHGELSLGASPFHVAVSQAIKNLGNMAFPEERIEAKLQSWMANYNAPGQATQIARTIRSNVADLAATISDARAAPDVLRRAIIVTSSLSKQQVADAFEDIQNGERPSPSFVQMYWLLQTFFGACTEVGATGSLVCRP